MPSAADEPKSPILANVVVVAGFVVLFTTFVTDSHWSWIIGGGMLLAGALWAGARTTDAVVPVAGPVQDRTGGPSHGRTS